VPRLKTILLDLTLATPEENLACDEALLDRCDAGDGPEVLRFWESEFAFVAVGYSNQIGREVNIHTCRERTIPILRRCSGGGTVVQGPGCLNYALILRIDSNPALKTVTSTNRFIMERNRTTIERLLRTPHPTSNIQHPESSIQNPASRIQHPESSIQHPASRILIRGHTDLAIGDLKFSGNAQRRKHRAVLFHGSFLLNFNLALIDELLPLPSKQPDYRRNRSHHDFLTNLGVDTPALKSALINAWNAMDGGTDPSLDRIQRLVAEKYSRTEWNQKH
jgi:lipoate-protein ligase A